MIEFEPSHLSRSYPAGQSITFPIDCQIKGDILIEGDDLQLTDTQLQLSVSRITILSH